jgi:hypothetical protein
VWNPSFGNLTAPVTVTTVPHAFRSEAFEESGCPFLAALNKEGVPSSSLYPCRFSISRSTGNARHSHAPIPARSPKRFVRKSCLSSRISFLPTGTGGAYRGAIRKLREHAEELLAIEVTIPRLWDRRPSRKRPRLREAAISKDTIKTAAQQTAQC